MKRTVGRRGRHSIRALLVMAALPMIASALLACGGEHESQPADKGNAAPQKQATPPSTAPAAPSTTVPAKPPAPAPAAHEAVSTAPADYFQKQPQVKKWQDKEGHHLELTIAPKPGAVWPQGTEMRFVIELDHQCRRWKVDPSGQAFANQTIARFGALENTTLIFFASRQQPAAGAPIVIDVLCSEPTGILRADIQPSAP